MDIRGVEVKVKSYSAIPALSGDLEEFEVRQQKNFKKRGHRNQEIKK